MTRHKFPYAQLWHIWHAVTRHNDIMVTWHIPTRTDVAHWVIWISVLQMGLRPIRRTAPMWHFPERPFGELPHAIHILVAHGKSTSLMTKSMVYCPPERVNSIEILVWTLLTQLNTPFHFLVHNIYVAHTTVLTLSAIIYDSVHICFCLSRTQWQDDGSKSNQLLRSKKTCHPPANADPSRVVIGWDTIE